jgi:hypothetical protein
MIRVMVVVSTLKHQSISARHCGATSQKTGIFSLPLEPVISSFYFLIVLILNSFYWFISKRC